MMRHSWVGSATHPQWVVYKGIGGGGVLRSSRTRYGGISLAFAGVVYPGTLAFRLLYSLVWLRLVSIKINQKGHWFVLT